MGILPLNLPHFLQCLVPCRFLNSGNPFGIAAADLLAVDFLNPAAQRAGAGEEDFVRLHHLLHGKRLFNHRNAHRFALGDAVRTRDARQNQVVAGRGFQRAVFQYMHVGMRAFGHAVSAVENRFVAAAGCK